MKINFSLWAIIVAVFLFSCKKDSAGDPLIPVNPSLTPVLLSKWIAIDTTRTAPHDTAGKMTFTYDGSNRPLTLTYIDYKLNGDSNFHWKVKYEYTGTDSLATRTIEYTKEFQSPVSISYDTFYYHFTNGICDRDSLQGTNGNFYYTNKYVYLPGYTKRTIANRTFTPSYMASGNSNIYQTKVNGNVTYQVDTLVTQYTINGQPPASSYLKNEYTVSYSANADPFYKITQPVKREYFGEDDWLPFGKYVSKKLVNTLSNTQSYWTPGGSVNTSNNTTSYSYTFRADGMPIQGRITYSEPGYPDTKYKTVYIYQ